MKEIILACDLDNTLIYSYKHRTPGDFCVEQLEGREQSFITHETLARLRQLPENVRLVPVTTRSHEQYLRIVWPQGSPRLAITTNGGLLLRDGAPEVEWRNHSLELAAGFHNILHQLDCELGMRESFAKRRIVDEMYLYVVCQDRAEAKQCLADYAGYGDLQVCRGGRKVYFLPPQINKGAAVQRLRVMRPNAFLLAAGDSELDLPMLEQADIALLPNEELAALLKNPHKYVCPDGQHFAEFVLSTAFVWACEKEILV